ncbi:MAG: malate/lactate/ureidoglycolate dehydrogenase [Acetobacteraceae bacterium]
MASTPRFRYEGDTLCEPETQTAMPSFTPEALRAVTTLIVSRMGSAAEETEEIADHLVRANLAGHDSHGVGMLPTYVRLLQDGLLVPNQTTQTVLDAGALLVIDARRGFGQRVTADAVRRAIGRARELGACVLALRNASHIGRIGTYGELATRAGCAFTAFVNVADHHDVQAPWACAEPRLGTNPFCTAVPGADGETLLLDMATTTIAAGKARVAYNKGTTVADGCLIDAAGEPTNDPTGLIRDHTGALVSFGRHKGSGLAVMCEIMAGAIGGGQRVDEPAKGGVLNSMLATIIDLSKLGDPAASAGHVEATKSHIRSSRVAPGFDEVLLPGEPERRSAAARERDGIPVDATTWHDIREAAAKLGITAAELDRAAGAN